MKEKPGRNSILDFLSAKEKDFFLSDLLAAAETKNLATINKCIEDWEAVAELNSIEGFTKNTWESYKKLIDMGIINGY